mgnify:FL=1
MTDNSPFMKSIKKSVKRNPGSAVVMCLCVIGAVVTAMLPPLILERGVNLIATGRNIPFALAAAYFGMIVLADILESAQGASIVLFGQKLTHGLRSDLCRKLNRLGAGYFTSHESGRITSIFVNDADTIDALYSNGIVSMIADLFKIISILVIIFAKSPGLGILLLFVTPFLFWMTRIFQKNTLSAQLDNRIAVAKVNNHIPETLHNIRMIHVFRKERYMEEKYDEYISESYHAVNRSNFYDSIYSPIILLTQAVMIAGMMIGAAQGSSMQQFFGMNVGSAVAVISYVRKIFAPLESIGMEIQSIQSAMAGVKNINAFLKEEELSESDKCILPDKYHQDIVFQNVTFGYKPEMPVFSEYSFTISEGENVTFVGRTGAGKSTIFRLLTGLYTPQSGQIKVAGIDPTVLAPADRRKLFGIVEQKFHIVPGNVRDQITLYDSEISDQMVEDALSSVQMLDVIGNLKDGLDTTMHSDLFSQGQLQLLAIARAMVTSPSILLLDEITANLDSNTETQVLEAIKKAAESRTVLSISHRYSNILKNERIIQMDAS